MRTGSRKTRVAIALIAVWASGFFLTSKASAQTAEEAVLMMVFGLDLATAAGSKHPYAMPIRIKKVTNCKYDALFFLDDPEPVMALNLDFSELLPYSVIPDANQPTLFVPVLVGTDLVVIKTRDKKSGDLEVMSRGDTLENFLHGNNQPKARLEAAAEYFRSTFCKGRAF